MTLFWVFPQPLSGANSIWIKGGYRSSCSRLILTMSGRG
jgi:hypothetical protein